MASIAVLGSNGQLGSDIKKVLSNSKHDTIFLDRTFVDIKNRETWTNLESLSSYDYIINCTAYNKVDDAEDSSDDAFLINAIFPHALAKIAKKSNAVLIHFSTDYVFDGQSQIAYKESDCPNPTSVYGLSKYCGEKNIQNTCEKYFIFRVSSLFGVAGSSGKGGNFIETMLRLAREGKELKVINDQIMSPTHTLDVANAVAHFINTKNANFGVFHCCCSDSCSWFEFTREIFSLTNTNSNLFETVYSDYKTKANRPKMSVLDNSKINFFYQMPIWKTALIDYLKLRGYA